MVMISGNIEKTAYEMIETFKYLDYENLHKAIAAAEKRHPKWLTNKIKEILKSLYTK